jgi:hypothetical protein
MKTIIPLEVLSVLLHKIKKPDIIRFNMLYHNNIINI